MNEKQTSSPEKPISQNENISVENYDVAVIGGGINGVGIARDLSIRGLKVILFEKEDFGWGTTWASSCLMHGGARYIINDIGVTYKSSKEAGVAKKISTHLLSRRPFIIVSHSKTMTKLFDIYMSVYDIFSTMRGAIRHFKINQEEVEKITGREVISKGGGVVTEEYAVDPVRLSVLNAISAKDFGAKVLNHTEVIKIKKENNQYLLVAKNTLSNSEIIVKSKIVVNTTGPWADKFILNATENNEKKKRLRPTKGIHIVFPGKILNSVISFQAIDGRYLLFVPLEDRTILGTTDDDFFGDPDEVEILRDEVEYLLHSAEKFIPRIREFKPFSTKVGLRPTPYVYGVNEDKITREFEIEDDDGFISVFGGKLASYRLLAEIVSDLVCKKLGVNKKSKTHLIPLPGSENSEGEENDDIEKFSEKIKDYLSRNFKIPEEIAHFMAKKYGWRSKEILSQYGLGEPICECSKVYEGEIRYAIEKEMAHTLEDVARRTWAGDGFCNGILCAKKIIKILLQKERKPEVGKFISRREKLLEPVKKYNQKLWEEFQKFKNQMLKD